MSSISRETSRDLFYHMLRLRIVEETLAERYSEQEMRCPVHLVVGQEAVETAAVRVLKKDDWIMSGHRAHGHYLAKGGDLKAMIAEIYGKETGCANGIGGSMHLIDLDSGFLGSVPIVSSTIPIAAGTAFASKMRGEDRVTMICFGDGAMEAGVVHETMNFAVTNDLPLVFLCENNFYSVYSPLSVRQPEGRTLSNIAEGHGIQTFSGDGNNPDQVFEYTTEAVNIARTQKKPVFLEFETYRWLEHCGPNFDNDIGYRTEEEYLQWRERDPIKLYSEKLLADNLITEDEISDWKAEIMDEVNQAFMFAKQSPFPATDKVGENVYA